MSQHLKKYLDDPDSGLEHLWAHALERFENPSRWDVVTFHFVCRGVKTGRVVHHGNLSLLVHLALDVESMGWEGCLSRVVAAYPFVRRCRRVLKNIDTVVKSRRAELEDISKRYEGLKALVEKISGIFRELEEDHPGVYRLLGEV